MKIVLDTNVVVSGVISPSGPPHLILQAAVSHAIHAILSPAIVAEYFKVLLRPQFRQVEEEMRQLIDDLRADRQLIEPPSLPITLPHDPDRIFIECAVAGRADGIVTGNNRHFPPKACLGVRVLSPAEFLAELDRPQRP